MLLTPAELMRTPKLPPKVAPPLNPVKNTSETPTFSSNCLVTAKVLVSILVMIP